MKNASFAFYHSIARRCDEALPSVIAKTGYSRWINLKRSEDAVHSMMNVARSIVLLLSQCGQVVGVGSI